MLRIRMEHYIASQNGHERVVELLLASGADKDAAAIDGSTPLSITSQNGHSSVVGLLLAAGADKNAVMNNGARVRGQG